ncbi:imidazole glycerol phosphate synthase subunit HisH [Luteococcus sp. OSA5]|uniref:imidazole glycerol phosphate synthase subunit HisH n=1 Tax=Luteococcus sp. OSA5 TaxID=3401630 RepID=UPI003B436DBA
MTRRVGVLDYGSGNLHSACRALEAAGATVVLSAEHATLASCDQLLLPGVGAFGACMDGLLRVGGDDLVRDWAASEKPLLGICVGHQVLFEAGVEHGRRVAGLGVLPGTVERLAARRLPHMGWNGVEVDPASPGLFAGVEAERFYFVHSYAVRTVAAQLRDEVVWAEHDGDRFVAAVQRGAVCSTQFHPEKSGAAGGRLLSTWVARPMG